MSKKSQIIPLMKLAHRWVNAGRFPTFAVAAVNVNARGHEGADDVRRRRAFQPISAGCPAPHPRCYNEEGERRVRLRWPARLEPHTPLTETSEILGKGAPGCPSE